MTDNTGGDAAPGRPIHRFRYNIRGMLLNGALAAAFVAGALLLAREAIGVHRTLLQLSGLCFLAFMVGSLAFALSGSRLGVIVGDRGIADHTRPWMRRSLTWEDISHVSVRALPGLGHVVAIVPADARQRAIHVSSRTVCDIPEGLVAAIEENENFRGRFI